MYKIKNYLNIKRIKSYLIQYFVYTYRNQTYNFLVIDKIELIINKYNILFNFVLNFLIYKHFEI